MYYETLALICNDYIQRNKIFRSISLLAFGISLFFEIMIISVIPSPFNNFLFICMFVPACLCALLHTMVPREARRVSEPKTGEREWL